MIDIIKLATEHNLAIEVKPMDGSYRPLVGNVKYILILTNGSLKKSITVTTNDAESSVKLALHDAIARLIR